MHFDFMSVILLCGNQWHVSATRGHIQGGQNKNTDTIIVGQNQATVTNHIVLLLKFMVEY